MNDDGPSRVMNDGGHRHMNDDWHSRVSGYLDGELSAGERHEFERRLASDPELARELAEMRSLKEVTGSMKLRDFPDEIWEHYWTGTYNRLERRVGWILFSIGVIILLAGGLYHLAISILRGAGEPLWIRIAIAALSSGFAVLIISVLRERIFMHRHDPYREVKR